jgi:CBS domain-containing protein
MSKKPISVEKNTLATDILDKMNKKKSQIYVFMKERILEKL